MLHFFFFNDTATTEIYTPFPTRRSSDLCACARKRHCRPWRSCWSNTCANPDPHACLQPRSEEHTSELQSRPHLVCRLLLEKKKNSQTRSHLHNNYTAGRRAPVKTRESRM